MDSMNERRNMVELYYAEDDADIAGVVKEYLEQKHFPVTVYATLSQLRQALVCHVPTLVLLDWNMPDGGVCFEIQLYSH